MRKNGAAEKIVSVFRVAVEICDAVKRRPYLFLRLEIRAELCHSGADVDVIPLSREIRRPESRPAYAEHNTVSVSDNVKERPCVLRRASVVLLRHEGCDLIRQLLGDKPVIVYIVAGNVKRALGRVKGER